MKIYAHTKSNPQSTSDIDINQLLGVIKSVVFVDDVDNYQPKDNHVYGASRFNSNIGDMSRQELLQLPKKQLESITDVNILRKLHFNDLTFNQQRMLTLANDTNFISNLSDVKNFLIKLKQCRIFRVWDTDKNNSFADMLYNQGALVQDSDVKNIVQRLHVKDYSYSTYSYIEANWNALLVVFEYSEPYTFEAVDPDSNPDGVTIDNFDVYIKIDINNKTHEGYGVISFHNPEFSMNHPYSEYPTDKG